MSADRWPEIPPACTDADLSRVLSVPLRTIQKRRKAKAWPIPTLPKIDRHNRTSRRDVISYLEREGVAATRRRRA